MIRITNIYQGLQDSQATLEKKAAKLLQISPQDIASLQICKQSVDARKKHDLHYTTSVDILLHDPKAEQRILSKTSSRQISATPIIEYHFPKVVSPPKHPVVVGLGPSGLFAALMLARAGVPPVILERGKPVEERILDVERFWQEGILDENSNVQFGEGGAGTFSDGKLSTGTKDPRNHHLFQIMVEKGADPDILYSNKPHIGTDVLQTVVKHIRQELLDLGCDIRFQHQMVGIEHRGEAITALQVQSPDAVYTLPASHVVCAIGHSARDTFQLLYDSQLPLEPKKFAIGTRIEHLQSQMGLAQYGEEYHKLPATDYKLACHLPNGRSLFSFCVCPGGVVVNASSRPNTLVTNGMSYRSRDKDNINGGLLVGVQPEDFHGYDGFSGSHPLAGMFFQEYWEKQAFLQGGSQHKAPCQRVEDFLLRRPSQGCGTVVPSFTSSVHYTDLSPCLPSYIYDTIAEGLPHLGNKIQGFHHPDAILTAIETRSSSPIRLIRDEQFQSTLRGFFPCGEGAGYAGGIVSAAVDGMKVAEALVQYG